MPVLDQASGHCGKNHKENTHPLGPCGHVALMLHSANPFDVSKKSPLSLFYRLGRSSNGVIVNGHPLLSWMNRTLAYGLRSRPLGILQCILVDSIRRVAVSLCEFF